MTPAVIRFLRSSTCWIGNSKLKRAAILFILPLLLLFLSAAGYSFAQTSIPTIISHQGRLLNASSQPVTSNVSVEFKIYNAASGGSQVWTETQSITPDNLGFYDTFLGGVTALPATLPNPSYLQITVQGETLSPRLQFGAVPFALKAKGSAGVLASQFELDENSGTQFTDSSGWDNNAIAPVGGIAMGSGGHSGKSVNFSGGVLTVTNGNSIPDSPQVWAEAWVRPNITSSTRTIVAKTNSYSLKQIGNQINFAVNLVGALSCNVTSSATIDASGNWFHVSGWYNGLEIIVEVDGQRTDSSCTNGPIVNSVGAALNIGGIYNGSTVSEDFSGRIDEVRIRTVAPF